MSDASIVTEPSRPPADRFSLSGPTRSLDLRIHAARRDVADVALAGVLFAPHYARAEMRSVAASHVMVRSAPRDDAEAVSQLLCGESFAVLDISGGWAWGFCGHDHYVGYVPAEVVGMPVTATHSISAPLALTFAGPDIKTPVTASLPFGALVAGTMDDGFLATALGHIHHRHLTPVGDRATDPVAVAEALIGQPYRWGGRGGEGIDCSGLVQIALAACGIAAPRDTDQQRAALGTEIAEGDTLMRGDIIFFPGHVGFMIDGDRLIHANAHWMAVTVEPLADVVARLTPSHDRPILARRRLA